MNKFDVIVIGAGAAGMVAAGTAADNGARTLLIEKMHRPGRKLYITGKGRCNLTNKTELHDFLSHFESGKNFIRYAVSSFSPDDLIKFFRQIGIITQVERGNRVFPESNKASDVVDALNLWTKKKNVKIKCNCIAKELLITDNQINGVKVNSTISGNETSYFADTVIVATGGLSYPATGSTGDGYRFARNAGHSIAETRPALVPLETKGTVAQSLQGLSLRNVKVSLIVNSKKVTDGFGEMLFTHFGLSGPVILTLSRKAVDSLREKKEVVFSLDLKPALDENKLNERLLRDFRDCGKQKFRNILKGLLPKKLIPVCISMTRVPAEKFGHQITADERKRLKMWLKDFRFQVKGYRPFKEAIITAGGVSTKEIGSKTMESKIVKGLYFAGEVLDVDADTGGFNLQAAFSTARIAGKAVSAYIEKRIS